MSATLVVKVGSFTEFRQEIDGGKVRLCSTESTRGAAGPLATRELGLHIQGINLDQEIIWLCYSRTIQLGPNGKPWRDTDKKVSRAWAGRWMTQQLGLFDAAAVNDDASTVVGVPPSPPPQRTRQAAPKKATIEHPTPEHVIAQVKGEQHTHRWVSVSAEHGRREHTVTYTVLPLAPGSHTPSEPCSSCGARRFRTYYWVANRHHDERGHPDQRSSLGLRSLHQLSAREPSRRIHLTNTRGIRCQTNSSI